METKIMRFASILVRLFLAGLFIYAGALKAATPHAFLVDIENYGILPRFLAVGLSLYLPYLEILCGLGLLFKRWDGGAYLILSMLMLGFMAALISAWARDLNIECGCFGSGGVRGDYRMDLGRDFAVLLALGSLWMEKVRGKRMEPCLDRSEDRE